jgi:hypothetical protein
MTVDRSYAVLATSLCLVFAAAPAAHAGDDSAAVLSPLAISVHKPADPVRAADGKVHLAYELELANRSSDDVTVDRIEPVADGRRIGAALTGEALAARLRLDRPGAGQATLEAGTGATVFMDVAYSPGRRTPPEVRHRFTLTAAPADESAAPRTISFAGIAARVRDSKPLELVPPLAGERWLAASGCCTLNPHRAATLPIDGATYVPERFAIDFVQLDDEMRLFAGPEDELASYAFYGAPVHATAGGRVVRVRDRLPEQVPGSLPPDATIQTAAGNYVVTTIRGFAGRFAFYAHLQRGSVLVRRGDRVRRGQIIGLLGNSGNTDAPHLHFHVMSTPSPLRSNGLPFSFDSFRGQGLVTDPGPMFAGEPTPVDRGAYAGPHRRRLPLDNQLLGFGD